MEHRPSPLAGRHATKRRPGLSRSAVVYAGALMVTVVVAVVLSLTLGGSTSTPPGRVLATGDDRWRESRASNTTVPAPVPESPSLAEWEAAVPILEEATKTGPDDAAANRQLALAYYNVGRLQDARKIYETMLADKEDAVLRNRLGNVLRDLGDLAAAEAQYRRALNQNPESSDPYMNFSEMLWRMHRDGEAVAVLEEGLDKVSPESRPVLERALSIIQGGSATTTST